MAPCASRLIEDCAVNINLAMPVNITGGFAIGIKRGAIVMERRVMMDVKKQVNTVVASYCRS